ncbi:Bifunctional epoxide hydrolase 2 [Ananas comosus]|uniref:Bifunctional epoxide hydrolase 2 n=1 Tax=Ananas comosus TaxID=4615 RepID=A0A199UG47_ANACO|nr:Bifunctional epoxide hydrolase 2 [Ananas comosus]
MAAAGGKGAPERIRRGLRTALFVVTMVASLLATSAPALVAVADAGAALALAARLACGGGGGCGVRAQVERYGFRSSLMDVPLASLLRSLVITCVYCLSDDPGLSHGPYLGTAALCSLASVVFLTIKACVYTPISYIRPEAPPSLASEDLHSRKSWGMPVLFLTSLLFALGHLVVAYRTRCRARRKLMFHRIDPESVLAYRNMFFSYQKVPRSPTPCGGKIYSRSESETKRKAILCCERDLPISFLAESDSLFIACQGLTIHYKLSLHDLPPTISLSSSRLKLQSPLVKTKTHHHLYRSFSQKYYDTSLYDPLLDESATSPTLLSDGIPLLSLDDGNGDLGSSNYVNMGIGVEEKVELAVVLVHGFGGGVFSWRHVSSVLARQVGCAVVAFDRPGWGLTSRPRRKDWEDKRLPNPYMLDSQVDLLISFCSEMGFSSVILVGHDDGGLLALKAAEKVRSSADPAKVEIKGVVLVSVSLSREVVPSFARILLHTPLGKKHMVRPLLRTEITQVINRRAWYDATKLTAEVLNLYKAPLFVEGWDEALHEIGRLSFATVLSSQSAAALLKSAEDLPVLVVAGAEDVLVPFKSVQAMASKLRLIAISGCGHLPHEECPKALLAALTPFITRLLLPADASRRH